MAKRKHNFRAHNLYKDEVRAPELKLFKVTHTITYTTYEVGVDKQDAHRLACERQPQLIYPSTTQKILEEIDLHGKEENNAPEVQNGGGDGIPQ